MDWQTIEMMGYAHYSGRGYRVLVSLVSNSDYDFVVEKNGEFSRVNVKLAGLKKKADPNSWSISQASGSITRPIKKGISGVDIYLVWLPHQNRFIELNGKFFIGVNSKSKLITRNAMNCGTED